jgi:Glycosyl hydrolases family 18
MEGFLMAIFNGFWQGYDPTPPTNYLNLTPAYVNTVTLFVAAPSPSSTVATGYLCSKFSASQQQTWAQQLQQQNQQVLMSFMDTPTTWWNSVNVTTFAQSVAQEVMAASGWGLNGVDVDLESGMPANVWVDTFVSLITALRTAIGPSAILTADAYTQSANETAVLEQTKDQLSWVNTMGYGWDAGAMESAAEHYANIMGGMNKVAIGVGVAYQGGQSTPLSEVAVLAQYAQQNGAGMMVFPLNNDNPATSGDPAVWGYCSTIEANLISQAAEGLSQSAGL